jgi:hypothetical protein
MMLEPGRSGAAELAVGPGDEGGWFEYRTAPEAKHGGIACRGGRSANRDSPEHQCNPRKHGCVSRRGTILYPLNISTL